MKYKREVKLLDLLIRIIDEIDKGKHLYTVLSGRSKENESEWHRDSAVFSISV